MRPTQADLQSWNSEVVTQSIFKQIRISLEEAHQISTLHSTCDETGMATARKEGFIEGICAFFDEYEMTLQEAQADEN